MRGGLSCIYVETVIPQLDYVEKYWVSTENGLLVSAETWKKDTLIYRMTGYSVEQPVRSDADFTLPDGRLIHSLGA